MSSYDEHYLQIQTKVNQWSQQAQVEDQKKKEEVKEKVKEEKKVPKTKTPVGQKKDTTTELPAQFDPEFVEEGWYAWWEKMKFFHADEQKVLSKEKAPYTMMIPPPNVTGALHLGHGLMLAIEDLISRWKRMSGFEMLWLPGVDHAGISCQTVVENKLWKDEKKTRHDYGREDFVNKVWQWKADYGDRITNQFRRYGVSLDWDRFCFTLDDKNSKAVKEAFVQMYEKGIIYRATRLVNWCCAMNTALSDIEVDKEDLKEPKKLKVPVPNSGDPKQKANWKEYEFGYFTNFIYKIKGSDRTIEVATTRLETMLGDVAVAVHPDDPRYQELIGKELIHPFIPERKMVIIADSILVDMALGTGAVKITPAHDHNDFLCGQRHGLPFINIFNDNGTINSNGGKFAEKFRFDVRLEMEKEMQELGLFVSKTPKEMVLGRCLKTGDIIEPLIKPQWYVDCKDMAKRSLDAAESKELVILPEFYNQTWRDWLGNIQDWCISRQLWWGHRIPAYLTKIPNVIDHPQSENADHWVIARSEEEAKQKAAERHKVDISQVHLIQDEDVLDTWFSSGLFPFATLGWPDVENPDLKAFFPGEILETGHDIIFFWVARMVMMSLCLLDKLPFKYVFLHALVKDKEGRKMSKSLGNVIDPLEVIDGCTLDALIDKVKTSNLHPAEVDKSIKNLKRDFKDGIPACGSDALRFSLLAFMINPRQINLDLSRVVGYRNFCNKIWNAFKYAKLNWPEGWKASKDFSGLKFNHADKWILSKLSKTIKNANEALQSYEFGTFAQSLYEFWLKDFCDVYIEVSKLSLSAEADPESQTASRNVLFQVIENGLRLFAVMMPYITEELWQRLPFADGLPCESICIAPFPTEFNHNVTETEVQEFETINEILFNVRSLRESVSIPKKEWPVLSLYPRDEVYRTLLIEQQGYFKKLCGIGEVIILASNEQPAGTLKRVIAGHSVYLHVKGLIDIKGAVAKLNKDLAEKEKFRKDYESKVGNNSLPENVRQDTYVKLDQILVEIASIKAGVDELSAI